MAASHLHLLQNIPVPEPQTLPEEERKWLACRLQLVHLLTRSHQSDSFTASIIRKAMASYQRPYICAGDFEDLVDAGFLVRAPNTTNKYQLSPEPVMDYGVLIRRRLRPA